MSAQPLRIILVDDHQILRDGIRALLEGEPGVSVVGECGSGAEALALCAKEPPDLVVLDLSLPDMSGLDVLRQLQETQPGIRVVVLSMHTQREFVLQAIARGCAAYVPKATAHTSLVEAIQAVRRGERFLHPKVASVLIESFGGDMSEIQQFQALSERERDVLQQTAWGFNSREIGAKLALSPKTVETYRQRAMEKLGLEHRADLIRFALKAGILGEHGPQ
ncbi:MAG TPA: response regulator transcription factor [Anaerolineales bacterium]|nr:response regulator transcription factor [Anaerolineales bacterium]